MAILNTGANPIAALGPDAGERLNVAHQFAKLLEGERLRAIAKRAIRVGMNLDDEAVGAYGDCGAGDWRDEVANSRGVTRINDDR
jgi:hypothetical protein